jgi:L-methionine (R)-S-oxide reductase
MTAKAELYRDLCSQLRGLLDGERDPIANAANTAALVFQTLPDINWVGFYFARDKGDLILGPFQGKPACVRLPAGKGVCGAAVREDRTVLVEDVHAFPGHIACDVASRSEAVVPLKQGGRIVGVFDVDSPVVGRFDDADRAGLQEVVALYSAASDLSTF